MTIKQLQTELAWALDECKSNEEEIKLLNTEIKARFDFPLMGTVEHYKIILFDKERGFTMYNQTTARPAGH